MFDVFWPSWSQYVWTKNLIKFYSITLYHPQKGSCLYMPALICVCIHPYSTCSHLVLTCIWGVGGGGFTVCHLHPPSSVVVHAHPHLCLHSHASTCSYLKLTHIWDDGGAGAGGSCLLFMSLTSLSLLLTTLAAPMPTGCGLCMYSPAPWFCIRYIISVHMIIILLTIKAWIINLNYKSLHK